MQFEHVGEGGIFLWGTLPDEADLDLLVQDAWRNKIILMRSAVFSANNVPNRHIRFNVAFCQQPGLSKFLSQYLREQLETSMTKTTSDDVYYLKPNKK